jgi:hypothetical protein
MALLPSELWDHILSYLSLLSVLLTLHSSYHCTTPPPNVGFILIVLHLCLHSLGAGVKQTGCGACVAGVLGLLRPGPGQPSPC